MGASISYKYTNGYAINHKYRTMTVIIDESSATDPVLCCSYADDAISMPSGFSDNAISSWKEFFKYRPCILCGNEVLEYLDPDNYDLRDDGTPSLLNGRTHNTVNGRMGVSSYEDHWLWNSDKQKMMRVMIEWPRLGIKISKNGTVVSISVTDRPNAYGYSYQAYYLNGVSYDHLYIETNFLHIANDGDWTSNRDVLFFADPTEMPESRRYHTDEGLCTKTTLLSGIRRVQVGTPNYHLTNYHQLNLIQCIWALQSKSITNPKIAGMPSTLYGPFDPTLTDGMFLYRHDNGGTYPEYRSVLFGIRDLFFMPGDSTDQFIIYDGICCTDFGEFYIMRNGYETPRWGSIDNYRKVTTGTGQRDHERFIKTVVGDMNGLLLPDSIYNIDNTDYDPSSYYWGYYGLSRSHSVADTNRVEFSDPELDGTDPVVCGQPLDSDGATSYGGIFSIGCRQYSDIDNAYVRVSVLL